MWTGRRCAVFAAGHSGHFLARAAAHRDSAEGVPLSRPGADGKGERSVPRGRGTARLCSRPVCPPGPGQPARRCCPASPPVWPSGTRSGPFAFHVAFSPAFPPRRTGSVHSSSYFCITFLFVSFLRERSKQNMHKREDK